MNVDRILGLEDWLPQSSANERMTFYLTLRLQTEDKSPSMNTNRQAFGTAAFFDARRVSSLSEFARSLKLPAKTALSESNSTRAEVV